MATSTYSYRRSTNQTTSSAGARGGGAVARPDDDTALRSKLEAARRQRTAFYRRLAETGARAAHPDDDGGGAAEEVDVDVDDAETLMARQHREQRLGVASPRLDVVSSVSSTNTALLEQPEPRSRQVVHPAR